MPNNLFGYDASDYAADVRSRPGGVNYNPAVSGLNHGWNGRNPDPFTRFDGTFKGFDGDTAYDIRRDAKRIVKPAAAALAAQNALWDPTLALARRGAADYGDLWRTEADKTRGWAEGALDNYGDDETNALLRLLMQDATGLVQGGNNPYEDRDTVQSIRGAQSARGMGYGQSDAYGELIGLDRAREGRRIQRGNYAGGVVNLGQQYRATNLAQLLGLGPQGSNIMSPVQPTGTDDFLSLDVNDITQRRNDQAARRSGQQALWGAGISAVGNILGSWAGGGK